jgi:hypothetical protein
MGMGRTFVLPWGLLLAVSTGIFAQKPLDLVLVIEPVEWADTPGGRLSRTAEDLKLEPSDRLGVVELIGAPKVKAKLGEGKTKIGMRWRPTFRLGADATGPEQRARRIYDALEMATRLLPDDYDPDRRRAILLVTANEEFGSKTSIKNALAALKASQAAIVVLAEPERQKIPKRGVPVQPLAEAAGAEFLLLEGADPLNAAITRLRNR